MLPWAAWVVSARRGRTARPCRVGGLEDAGALGVKLARLAVVDGARGHQADARVAVLVVVPVEEVAAERAGVLDRVEPVGEPGPVLERRNWASEYGLSVDV